MTAILKEDPPELARPGEKVPPAVDRLVRHCLEKRPDERFQSARDLAFDLDTALESSGRSGPRSVGRHGEGALSRRQGPASERPSPWPLLAGALAAGYLVGRQAHVSGG